MGRWPCRCLSAHAEPSERGSNARDMTHPQWDAVGCMRLSACACQPAPSHIRHKLDHQDPAHWAAGLQAPVSMPLSTIGRPFVQILTVQSFRGFPLHSRAACWPAGACQHALGHHREAAQDYEKALLAEAGEKAGEETRSQQFLAFYQKELALYAYSHLDLPVRGYSLDQEISPLFKVGRWPALVSKS